MDTTALDIKFDKNANAIIAREFKKIKLKKDQNLENLISRIKQNSKRYDCIVGLSGVLIVVIL